MKGLAGLLVIATIGASAGARVAAQSASCPDCVPAAFWEVSPTFWSGNAAEAMPESKGLDTARTADVGVAFSGGGTRSASAIIGQLRGLQANGWLEKVRYVTAVSGGSWAAVPFTYYHGQLSDLLGTLQPLNATTIEQVPAGLLAERVVHSGLGHVGLQEVPSFLPDAVAGVDITQLRKSLVTARSALRKIRKREVPDAERQNKTYAHMLGKVFLDGLIPDGNRHPYAWNLATAIEMSVLSGQPTKDFVVAPENRPFLIVGGTLVQRVGHEYPRLIPVEYTGLYTGVRQQFGTVGGTYLSPWAYDRLYLAPRSDSTVLVGPGPLGRPFTLADVIASSGAAPQLELMLGDKVPERLRGPLRRMSEAFPAFANVAVRGAVPGAASAELAHGDGGFTDNLAVMPLLVRQVHNIIVFVNSSSPYDGNDQLQSYFMPLRVRDGNGDKSMNPVFEKDGYRTVIDGLNAATRAGGGAIYCDRGWTVLGNEVYNIRGYKGLNICWVYNYAADAWKGSLPSAIKEWVNPPDKKHLSKQAKQLAHFPYYSTFGENKNGVIKLKALQVNLLADLAAWSVTNPVSTAAILRAFDAGVLPVPTSK